MLLSRLCALLLILSVLFGQRVSVDLLGSQVNPLAIMFIAVAALVWLRDGTGRAPYHPPWVSTLGPLLALMFALPVLGAIVGLSEFSQIYGLIVPCTILAILSLGRSVRLHGLQIGSIGFIMITAHGLYGLAQTLYRLNIVPHSFWAPMSEWDARSQLSLSESYLITGRSTGLFVNANEFGLWSCLAVVFSVIALRGWRQHAGIALGLSGAVGSQSRTAWIIVVVLLLILSMRMLHDRKVAGRAIIAVAAVAPFVLIAGLFGWIQRLTESTLVDRLSSGLGVIEGGADADGNLLARVSAWGDAWVFSADYPFGTMGPPQVKFGSFIDNQFVFLFLQGGPVLVVAFLIALVSPAVLARHGVPKAKLLWVVSMVMAVASFTMTPLQSVSAASLAWLSVASLLGQGRIAADNAPITTTTRGKSFVRPQLQV